MKALWSDGVTEFQGETVTLTPCHFNPKPVQQPHPPIYFGGESAPALRRVAERGDGWYGYDMSPEMLSERLPQLDAALARAGRSRDDITLIVGPNRHPVTAQTVPQYQALGVDQLVVPLFASSVEKLEVRIDALLTEVGG